VRRGLAILAVAALGAATLAAQRPAKPGEAQTPVELNCDALRWTGPLDKMTHDELGPAHTLDEAATILTRHKITFTRSRGMISATMPESEFKQIATLPQGEPIIFPDGDGGTICALVPGADSV
jgi:hypothetical protein